MSVKAFITKLLDKPEILQEETKVKITRLGASDGSTFVCHMFASRTFRWIFAQVGMETVQFVAHVAKHANALGFVSRV